MMEWNANAVLPNLLYVGGLSAVEDREGMARHRVRHVLTVASTKLAVKLPVELAIPPENWLRVPADDHPYFDLLGVLPKGAEFLSRALTAARASETAVLVHCASGVSRSVSVCVGFLMGCSSGQSFENSLAMVRLSRENASPNFGFRLQLELLDQELASVRRRTPNQAVEGAFTEDKQSGTASDGNAVQLLQTPQIATSEADVSLDMDAFRAAVQRARAQWSKQTAEDVFGQVMTQRDTANTLHARVDEVEVEITSLQNVATRSSTATANAGVASAQDSLRRGLTSCLQKLSSLQSQLDSFMPAEGDGVVDRPAATIRKSASSKVARLLTLGDSLLALASQQK